MNYDPTQRQKNTKRTVYAAPLFRLRQKRRRELLVGSGRAGFHARLCGDDDALCPVHHLRGCRRFCGHSRIPDIYQDEHGRERNHQAHTHAGRGLPFHHRCDNSLSGIFRLSILENHECKTINKVQLKQDKHV